MREFQKTLFSQYVKKKSDFMNEMLKLCRVRTCNSVNLACNVVLKVSIENSVSTFLGHRPSNQIL